MNGEERDWEGQSWWPGASWREQGLLPSSQLDHFGRCNELLNLSWDIVTPDCACSLSCHVASLLDQLGSAHGGEGGGPPQGRNLAGANSPCSGERSKLNSR